MTATAHAPLPTLSKPVAEPSADTQELYASFFSAEGTSAEAPLTSEPPLPEAEPLTSEPPLADAAPLTSESDPTPDSYGPGL